MGPVIHSSTQDQNLREMTLEVRSVQGDEMTKLLPTITMLINIGSAIWYLSKGDYPRCVYWIAAGLLTFTVTWWMK